MLYDLEDAEKIWDIPIPVIIRFLRLLAAAQKEESQGWLWSQPPAKLAEALESLWRNQIERAKATRDR